MKLSLSAILDKLTGRRRQVEIEPDSNLLINSNVNKLSLDERMAILMKNSNQYRGESLKIINEGSDLNGDKVFERILDFYENFQEKHAEDILVMVILKMIHYCVNKPFVDYIKLGIPFEGCAITF